MIEVKKTAIEGVLIIEPKVFGDDRGYFMETYNAPEFKEKGIPYHVGKFPMSANGRALIADGGKGFVKVLVGDELNEVLGVHIIGHAATELIAEAALAIGMEATAEEVTGTIHAHPTVSEAVREAFLASENRALHIPNKRRRS